MKQGWKNVSVGNVCTIVNGGTPKTNVKEYWGGGHLWITPKDMGNLGSIYVDSTERMITDAGLKNSSAKLIPENSIILSTRAPIGHLAINIKPISTNQGCKGIIPSEHVYTKYLYFFLLCSVKKLNEMGSGTTFKELSSSKLSDVGLPLPPLTEQKRIVAKLDQCFEAIDKARANVERNLKNAKELFQSQLNQIFSRKGDGWVEKKLGECIKLKSGDGLIAKNMNQNGIYSVYGGNGIAGYHDKFNLDGSRVIIGRVGALCGNARYINEKIWLTDNAFKVSEFYFDFDNAFLVFLLNHKNLRSYARQSAQPVISNSSTKDVILNFPLEVKIQKLIAIQLDKLKDNAQLLEQKYQKEMNTLDELKKSILQKAFNGEL